MATDSYSGALREMSQINERNLLYALDRLAVGFESEDPHIRHEAKMVAKQNISGIAASIEKTVNE